MLGEESDEFEGEPISHFELYLRAMEQAGADASTIHGLLANVMDRPVLEAIAEATLPEGARTFLRSNFQVIESNQLHAIAAAFTFGREDLIPDMFRALVDDVNDQHAGALSTFIWYLERHIEVDGEDHGPLSLRMVADICGTDDRRWAQAADAAEQALHARIALWDSIHQQILAA